MKLLFLMNLPSCLEFLQNIINLQLSIVIQQKSIISDMHYRQTTQIPETTLVDGWTDVAYDSNRKAQTY